MRAAPLLLSMGVVASALCQSEECKLSYDPEHAIKFEIGDLTVVVGDHYPHGGSDRPSYTGLHHLSHKLRPSNVFCPLYAGMIGLRRKCTIKPVGRDGAVLYVGDGRSRVSELYVVRAPHYVDHTARFTAGGRGGSWNNTSYMNGPADPGIFLVQTSGEWVRHYSAAHGDRASVAPADMDPLPPIKRVENARYPHGTNGFWDGFSDIRFDPKYALFYGRFDDMVLLFMVERKWGPSLIPYTSPSGGGYSKEWQRRNPAWDFRYWLRGLTPGQEVVIRSRVCYKPFVSQADVLAEYGTWHQELEAK